MNTRALLLAPFFVAPLLLAQTENPPSPPPPVTQAPALTQTSPNGRPNQAFVTRADDQKLYVPAQSALVAPEAAQALVEKFKSTYVTTTAPRLVVYVNRELIDTSSGLHLKDHTERYEKKVSATKGEETSSTIKTSGVNTYTVNAGAKPALADQQTVREIERLFGRVFRAGGAKLADQKTAATLLSATSGPLTGEQAAKERTALTQVADIAVEVLISSRSLTVAEVAGDATYTLPDIQVTAIRLSDSAIIGQAAASDVLGKSHQAAQIARRFTTADITEAVALALMEDMLTGAKR